MGSRSIARTLTLWYAVSLAVILTLSMSLLYRSLKLSLDAENRRVLEDRAQAILTLLDRKDDPVQALRRRVESEWAFRRFEKIYVRVRDRDGRVVAETPDLTPELRVRLGSSSIHPDGKPHLSSNGTLLELDQSERTSASPGQWAISLAMDLSAEQKILSAFERRMFLILAAAFVGAVFLGRLIARRGLSPVRSMASTLEQIHSEDLRRRITTAAPEELEMLKRTFNDLLDRIQSSMDKISRFSGDIAHEIRTPVGNLGGELEVALSRPRTVEEYQEILGSCLEECRRLGSIADSLLFLTRAESPSAQLQRRSLDLGAEIADLVEFHEASALEKGITLRSDVPEALLLDADHALLQAAIGNLLSNAFRYTPSGGSVSLSAREAGSEVVLEVADTGCGIATEHLPFVFDRLYRADAQRSSSQNFGLGLSIVHAIMRIHGGSAEIASAPGSGTRVSLRFPARAGDAS